MTLINSTRTKPPTDANILLWLVLVAAAGPALWLDYTTDANALHGVISWRQNVAIFRQQKLELKVIGTFVSKSYIAWI